MQRRDFLKANISKLSLISLYSIFSAANCLADADIDPILRQQLKTIDDLTIWVKGKTLTVDQWQDSVEKICSRIETRKLFKALDIDKFLKNNPLDPGKVASSKIDIQSLARMPFKNRIKTKIFSFSENTVIAPHAHNNMLSAHFVLKGSLQVNTYNRVKEEKGSMKIEAVQNRVLKPGDYITMSDARENIHGFKALEDKTTLFYLVLKNAQDDQEYINPEEWKGMVFLDIEDKGSKLIEAPVITKKEAYKKKDLS